MKRTSLTSVYGLRLAALSAAAALLAPPAPLAQEGGASLQPVIAAIVVNEQQRTVTFVDRDRDSVTFALGESPTGARRTLPVDQIEAAYFDFSALRWGDLIQANRAQNWGLAVRLLSPAITPMLPYLDIVNNNAVEQALAMGDAMMRAAATRAAAGGEPDLEAAERQYRAAYTTLRHVSRAEWSSAGQMAALKSLQCLLALNRPEPAHRLFQETIEPMPGDRVYGLYWLVKAGIDVQRGDYRAAMDGAVKSLSFDNKNIDTFPDALMISAYCYEALQEWYRARDVYYEVATIFPRTDWSRAARARLEFILDRGLTAEDETPAYEAVFFGLREDMNEKSRHLLKAGEPGDRPASAPAADADQDWDLRVLE